MMAQAKSEVGESGLSIPIERIKKYTEVKRKNAVTIQNIHDIIGGPNNNYTCCHEDQSEYIYKKCRDELVSTLDKTKRHVFYFQEKQSPLLNAIFVVVMKEKNSYQREHLVLWGVIQTRFNDVYPKVGFARTFDLCGKLF